MIFKRKKKSISSSSIDDSIDEKINSKAETLYVGVMCFTAACLSCMTLEVGTRSPLGQSVAKSSTFNAIFRRTYNMKIKITITNVIMSLITTIMLALGDVYRVPYLHVPWLFNTMRGMIFYEGPALFGLSQVWLPDAGFPAGGFIFITSLLFVEEICLWFDVFGSLKNCWNEYMKRSQVSQTESSTEDKKKGCNIDDRKEPVVKSNVSKDDNFKSIFNPTKILLSTSSNY